MLKLTLKASSPINKLFIILTILYSSFSVSDDFDCKYAMNSMQISYCAELKLTKAEEQMETYFVKAKQHNSEDPQLITAIDHSN